MTGLAVTPRLLADWPLPAVGQATDKDRRGRVLVLGGGAQVAGAAALTGVAALRVGAGKLQLGVSAQVATQLAIAVPEARVFPLPETTAGELAPEAAEVIGGALARTDAAVIGPGMLDEASAGELLLRLLEEEGPPIVVDAAAMPVLGDAPHLARQRAGRLILTPHAGEMARLCGCERGDIETDPLAAARSLAASLHAVIALKGATTFIVSPDGRAWRHDAGSPGLATSGSGDVLAGIIAGLLARGASPAQAAVWGVHVHGACGRRLAERIAPVGYLAREILGEIAPALSELEAASVA
jgi:ADP-dependent NAD(P)H-hydrate dehydratase